MSPTDRQRPGRRRQWGPRPRWIGRLLLGRCLPSRRLLMLAVCCALLPFDGCGPSRLDSKPRDRAISVDGKSDEWHDSMTFIEKANIGLGLFNDDGDLYLCIESFNREINLQAMNLGLTIWFDTEAGEEKSIGIEYPLGTGWARHEAGGSPDTRTADGDKGERVSSQLAVRGPGLYARQVMALSAATGIEVRSAAINDAFVYELRIPLRRDAQHPYGIGVEPGRAIGIRLETPEVPPMAKAQADQNRPGGGGRGGGRGGGMGGGMGGRGRGGFGGGGGGRRGGGSPGGDARPSTPKLPKPLKLALRVRLAPAGTAPAQPAPTQPGPAQAGAAKAEPAQPALAAPAATPAPAAQDDTSPPDSSSPR